MFESFWMKWLATRRDEAGPIKLRPTRGFLMFIAFIDLELVMVMITKADTLL